MALRSGDPARANGVPITFSPPSWKPGSGSAHLPPQTREDEVIGPSEHGFLQETPGRRLTHDPRPPPAPTLQRKGEGRQTRGGGRAATGDRARGAGEGTVARSSARPELASPPPSRRPASCGQPVGAGPARGARGAGAAARVGSPGAGRGAPLGSPCWTPRAQGTNVTCGSNVRRRGPGARWRAGRGERLAARPGSLPAPRRTAAPAETRLRGRAGEPRRAPRPPSTSHSRRAPPGTGPAPPERPGRRCPPAPGSAGSDPASRRAPRRWPLPAQRRARSHCPFMGRETPPCVRPFGLGPRPSILLCAWRGQPWLGSVSVPFSQGWRLGRQLGRRGGRRGPKRVLAPAPAPRLGPARVRASARAPTSPPPALDCLRRPVLHPSPSDADAPKTRKSEEKTAGTI